MIDQPTHYATAEGEYWHDWPINLVVVTEQDLDQAPPTESHQGSPVIWVESRIFPGMYLKVRALKWSDSREWDAIYGYRQTQDSA